MAYVVTDGQLTAIERADRPRVGSVRLSDSLVQSYETIWRTQPAVRTVVDFLARNIASLALQAFKMQGETDRVRDRDSELAQLLAKPSPTVTRYRLWDGLIHDLGIYDYGAWLKVKSAKGRPSALVRIPPRLIQPIGDSFLAPDRFLITGNRGRLEVGPESVVWFHGYSPEDNRLGCSPLESLRRILVEEYEAGRYREQVLRNGGRFSGYIKRPANATWKDGTRERFKTDWQAQYAGDGPQAGGTPILEDGMDFVASAQTSEQAQYVQSRKLTREEVASAYFIPPPMVGILDHATFSNITEQHKMLYQDTLGPRLNELEEEVELQVVPDFPDTETTYVKFNLAEKLRGSFEEQASTLQTATGAPWLTRNEARARVELPAIAGGDALVVPLNVLEGGQASPTDSGPKTVDDVTIHTKDDGVRTTAKARAHGRYEAKHEEVLKAFFERQGQAVKSALGAGVTSIVELWDGKRWDKELGDDLHALGALTSTEVGRKVVDALGGQADEYDVDRTQAFLKAVAGRVAGSVNATTRAQVKAALKADTPEDVMAAVDNTYKIAATSRASQLAVTAVTTWSGFASVEAGKTVAGDQATKTWITGAKPRPSHAAMNGETVGINEAFSNGADWPCSGDLDVDDVAGCNCEVEVGV